MFRTEFNDDMNWIQIRRSYQNIHNLSPTYAPEPKSY